MSEWLKIYIAVFASGCAAALVFTPVFRSIAGKTGFLDCPADNQIGRAHV